MGFQTSLIFYYQRVPLELNGSVYNLIISLGNIARNDIADSKGMRVFLTPKILGQFAFFFFFFEGRIFFFFYSYFIYLFLYFWLCWVFGSCEGFL